MAYPKSLRLLIRRRIESGVLPRSGLQRVSGGPGKGESCVACVEIIAKSQFAMEGHRRAAHGPSVPRGVLLPLECNAYRRRSRVRSIGHRMDVQEIRLIARRKLGNSAMSATRVAA